MNDDAAKLLIRGAVAETGLDEQFNRHLGELRQNYERIKSSGEEEQAGYLFALTYFMSDIQKDQ